VKITQNHPALRAPLLGKGGDIPISPFLKKNRNLFRRCPDMDLWDIASLRKKGASGWD